MSVSVKIAKPKHGWSDITITEDGEETKESFTGIFSYIDDVLEMFLDAFKSYVDHWKGVAITFDEEGSEFTLVIEPFSIMVIADRGKANSGFYSHRFYINGEAFILNILSELEENLPEWIDFCYMDKDIDNYYLKRLQCQQRIEYIKKRLKET